MARPKKPIKVLELQGTDRKCRIEARADELQLPAGPMGDPPEWFEADAREEWARLVNHPEYSKVLNPAFRGALIAYCVLYQRMIQDAQGKGEMSSGERRAFASLQMQMCITVASQSKVKMPDKKPAESKWAGTKPIPISTPA